MKATFVLNRPFEASTHRYGASRGAIPVAGLPLFPSGQPMCGGPSFARAQMANRLHNQYLIDDVSEVAQSYQGQNTRRVSAVHGRRRSVDALHIPQAPAPGAQLTSLAAVVRALEALVSPPLAVLEREHRHQDVSHTLNLIQASQRQAVRLLADNSHELKLTNDSAVLPYPSDGLTGLYCGRNLPSNKPASLYEITQQAFRVSVASKLTFLQDNIFNNVLNCGQADGLLPRRMHHGDDKYTLSALSSYLMLYNKMSTPLDFGLEGDGIGSRANNSDCREVANSAKAAATRRAHIMTLLYAIEARLAAEVDADADAIKGALALRGSSAPLAAGRGTGAQQRALTHLPNIVSCLAVCGHRVPEICLLLDLPLRGTVTKVRADELKSLIARELPLLSAVAPAVVQRLACEPAPRALSPGYSSDEYHHTVSGLASNASFLALLSISDGLRQVREKSLGALTLSDLVAGPRGGPLHQLAESNRQKLSE